VDDPVTRKLSSYTLLVPLSKMRTLEYEPLYSRSGKHNQLMTKYELREQNNPVGLLNVSNCCYLNSLLQCYFLMNDFMICLLTAEPLDRL
jgi:ubiquitin C-terminal hydrolase